MSLVLDSITEDKLTFDNGNWFKILNGTNQSNILVIEKLLDIKIHSKGNELILNGPSKEVTLGKELIQNFYKIISKGYFPSENDFKSGLKILSQRTHTIEDIFLDTICVTTDRKTIAPKSINQKLYIDSIKKNDIVFGIGPAGTGKTYLAVATAVASLNMKKVKKIILTRPAVEAGEKLGFLPGDLNEKVDPYLKPLFDALNDMLDFDTVSRLIDKQTIEIAPIAFMRGRTLNDAFIILDEAQNTTSSQMKMFLTRIGFNSKCVVTGDVTQIDLDKGSKSGLIEAQSILKDIDEIEFCSFDENDVVRHRLVKKIIEAYK
ncbi:MAG: PhoH family protein [Thermodesulfobacteriota bacteirum]|jgi:phosphate starvation-inducible PhoH-like protein|nr:PhoH family protein [Thermodesulfobacteriota bacterium]